MTIEQRLTNLEKLVTSFINAQASSSHYVKCDIDGCRHTDGEQQKEIEANTESITDTQLAVTETFEQSESNSEDITALQEAIVEVYEMIM